MRRDAPPANARLVGLTRALAALLAVDAVLAWLTIAGLVVLVERLWLGGARYVVPDQALAEHVWQLGAVRRLEGIASLLTAPAFLGWVLRARRNLPVPGDGDALGGRGRILAGFLVPGPNLWRPLLTIRELWVGSGAGVGWGWPGWWWALVLSAALADLTVRGLTWHATSAVALVAVFPLAALGECLKIAAAVLSIVVIRKIARGPGRACQRGPGLGAGAL